MRLSRDSWAVLGILVVITATYVLVVHRWQASQLRDLREQIAIEQRGLSSEADKADGVSRMLRQVEQMRRRYSTDWCRRLPERQELAGFLREITTNLSREKLDNPIIAPGNPTRGALYNVLPITMRFDGSFPALAGFLQRVDRMARLTRIEQLTIEPRGGHGQLAIVLGMNIYFTEQ